ncbi:MAG: Lrp/AsnC family transcriptional regulator [Candidatus Brocadiae bacterium]|nr:Lrp/AsnC family transcriptional regulator [Candidatus Brocadiia bacterium]
MVGGASSVKAPEPPAETPIGLDEDRKALVRLLQGDLPLVSEPFAELAGRLGRPVGELLAEIADLLDRGAIRRFGAVVNHRRLGYRANGMAVFRVPAGQVDGVGRALAAFGRVSHCYRRAQAPGWPYNLFAMVHGRRHEEVRRFVQGVAARHGLEDYDILFSTAEYKKTSMRYFEES